MKINVILLLMVLCACMSCKKKNIIEERIHKKWKAEKIKTQNPDLVAMGLDLSHTSEFSSWSQKSGYHTTFLGKYLIKEDSIFLNFDSYQTNEMSVKKDTTYMKSYKIEALDDTSFHLKVNQFDAFFIQVK